MILDGAVSAPARVHIEAMAPEVVIEVFKVSVVGVFFRRFANHVS